jgi:CHASE2 domain-containing sensor protein
VLVVGVPALLDLVRLLVPLAVGIALGYFLRRRRLNLDKITSGIILVLIFSLGFAMGSNGELLAVMPHVGLTAIVLVVMALLFSIVFVKAARKLVGI